MPDERVTDGAIPALKPCPFCGKKGLLKHVQVAEDCVMSWVQCTFCSARSADYESNMGTPDPIASWNSRPLEAKLESYLREANRKCEELKKENLVLRGSEQIVWFHGTAPKNVEAIQKTGFKEGTYFARHMEDAFAFGGSCVFVVEIHFESPPLDGWQVTCANHIEPRAIKKLVTMEGDRTTLNPPTQEAPSDK